MREKTTTKRNQTRYIIVELQKPRTTTKEPEPLAESKKREFIFTQSEKERNNTVTTSFARVNANY